MDTNTNTTINDHGYSTGPQAICTCGHTGHGNTSEHSGTHGLRNCKIANCNCTKFHWAAWTTIGLQNHFLIDAPY